MSHCDSIEEWTEVILVLAFIRFVLDLQSNVFFSGRVNNVPPELQQAYQTDKNILFSALTSELVLASMPVFNSEDHPWIHTALLMICLGSSAWYSSIVVKLYDFGVPEWPQMVTRLFYVHLFHDVFSVFLIISGAAKEAYDILADDTPFSRWMLTELHTFFVSCQLLLLGTYAVFQVASCAQRYTALV
ncbi:uncharacterized protein LOC142579050 [Dermacentor variabilis]|uniref:uncharacterized protein LOC142579050 n=1 Tax=Dermacentor variabilis TaxID=34621 RepID=UPI003F5B6FDD